MTADDTTPQTSADVIKRASDVMYEHANGGLYDPMGLARALDDAHLLADPADRDEAYRKGFYAGADAIIRDELADPADKANEAFTWRERALHWKADKERAEAHLRTLRVDLSTAERMSGDIEARAKRAEAEVAELRAMVDRVRLLDTGWKSGQGNRHAYCINPEGLRAAINVGES